MAKNNTTALTTKSKQPAHKMDTSIKDITAVRSSELTTKNSKVKIINLKKHGRAQYEQYSAVTHQELLPIINIIENKFNELSRNYDAKLKDMLKDIKKDTNNIKLNIFPSLINKVKDFFSQFSTQKIKEQLSSIAMWATSTEVDEFGLDPIFAAKAKVFFDFFYDKWWRVETIGINNIPLTGRALLVSNHSGGIPIDGAMIVTSIFREHPYKRIVRPLVEDFAYYMPFVSSFLIKTGSVRASQENAERLLKKDQLVVVFPEGLKGIGKPFKYRYKLQRFGRGGYIRLAIKTHSPIIPVAVVGAEEAYPIIGRIDWLGKLFGAPYLPVTPFFPWLGPLGAIPLPTKWYIKYGTPIDIGKYGEEDLENDILINRLSETVRTRIQEMLIELLKQRKSVFF